ncbi:MAG: hypothetical protein ACOC8F_01060 [Planctomycetota bacterium]
MTLIPRTAIVVLPVTIAVSLLSSLPAGDPPRTAETAPTTRPARRATTRPAAATRPTDYPPEPLVDACRAASKLWRRKLGGDFRVVVRPPFVVAGRAKLRAGDGEVRLERLVATSVVRPARAMWSSYFTARPARPVVVLLFDDAQTYREQAEKLFGDTDVPHFGYCRGDGTLVMNIATGTGTLVHELTHALIAPDFIAVPTWFNEGLASLHEQCRVGPERITGLCNWRLPALQAAVRDEDLRPLRELVTARDFYGPQRGLNYAHARYFVMYLQQRGRLKRFYKTFRAMWHESLVRSEGGPGEVAPDVRAIEAVLERDIDAVDAAWRRWVATLRYAP